MTWFIKKKQYISSTNEIFYNIWYISMINEILKESIQERTYYLNILKKYIGSPIIKVLTWQRRVGKSYILKNIIQHIVHKQIIPQNNIFYINKELPQRDHIESYKDLQSLFDEFITQTNNEKIFIGIDEIQHIYHREKYINGILTLYADRCEIFITGSNSSLLSSEIATYISGRYIEFMISPLSFEEFCQFKKDNQTQEVFLEYLKYGGLPGIFRMEYSDETIFNYLKSVYNTIVLKDIVSRFNIKNNDFFENLYKYIFANIGNIFSAKNISDYLKSQKIKISVDSVLNYLSYWEQTFILHKVKSFDPKTKKYFEIYNKYYASDLWLRNSLIGYNPSSDIWWLLENYLYIILKKHWRDITIWRLSNHKEIDFIAQKNGKKIYIQVATSILSPDTAQREYDSLESIDDNRPKYVLSLDSIPFWVKNWIQRYSIMKFEKTLQEIES